MYTGFWFKPCLSCSSSKYRVFRLVVFIAVLTVHRREESTVRELAERTLDEHLCKAHLLTECAYSQTEREPQGGEPLLKWRCGESNKQSFLLNTALIFAITNRASPLYSQNKTGKDSNRNSARVLACWGRAMHASGYVWAIWARRVKQHIRWMCCSQSERGGLLCKRRSPKPEGKGVMCNFRVHAVHFCRERIKHLEEGGSFN